MGMNMSGEVSDETYHNLAETWAASPEVRRIFGIKYYGRFKDDILVLIDNSLSECTRFVHLLRQKSKYFQLDVESVSKSVCVMLDVQLVKVPAAGGYAIKSVAYTKPTSIWSPLSSLSMHAWHTPLAWPDAYIQRLEDICSQNRDYIRCKKQFLQRLAEKCQSHAFLRNASTRKPCNKFLSSPPNKNSRTLYAVMPFFFGYDVAKFHDDLQTSCKKWSRNARFTISWALGGTHALKFFASLPKRTKSGG